MNTLSESTTLEFSVTATKTQLFMFSAITWNRHQIHFNKDQALAEGFPDVVIHRGLLGNFLARAVATWTGSDRSLKHLKWRVVQSAFPEQKLRIQGQWIAKDTLSLTILNPAGTTIATGEATVTIPYEKENS